MSIEHNHAFCDGCPSSGRATAPIDSDWSEEWETIPVGDGEAHLCPRCQLKRDQGLLGHDFVLVCARCERTSLDKPKMQQWWPMPDADAKPGTYANSLCDDCHDPETDVPQII